MNWTALEGGHGLLGTLKFTRERQGCEPGVAAWGCRVSGSGFEGVGFDGPHLRRPGMVTINPEF
jgi:hypothetical protein